MKFIGIALGGDMNSYAVACAFYEEYKIKTIILGKSPLYPTSHSKITEGYYNENIMDDNVFIDMLERINKKYPNEKKFLFGNMDYYIKLIIHNRKRIENISDTFIIPIVEEKMFDLLFCKDSFYKLCDKYHLNYPKTIVFDFKTDKYSDLKIDSYPIFMKPSNTVKYSKFEFDDKRKGYKINSKEELKDVIKKIKSSGFDDKFIIQEYIEGTDESMFVYTAYVSKNNKVQSITAGKILMHDRSPKLIGNYNAITNAYDKDFSMQIKNFLEKIKFTGICHFDVQYDINRKKFYVFEMNVRQGRSNLYTLAGKTNLMKLIVDDYIYNKENDFKITKEEYTVSIVPKFILKYSLKKNNQKIKIRNFRRFTLAPYDRKLIRYYYQFLWDYKIFKNYMKYNINKNI